jgi:starch phosphorylase
LDRHLGPDWLQHHDDPALWQRVYDVPDHELWNVKQDLKRKMFSFIWDRARQRWIEGEADATQLLASGTMLDPEALTIGFARRFATYKRATLVFRDLERLKRILLDSNRPVQLIFAGKAHPADEPAKHLIQQVVNLAKDHQLGARIAFVQDYDMNLARYLVQGVDVWLNNPRRPYEASGTSGQKAALNGTLNLSVLDGWWPEAYDGDNGWAIGGRNHRDEGEDQDAPDAESLYQLLEQEVVPLFYQRDADGIPRGWVQAMKESMRTVSPAFSLRRMLKEYTERAYLPAARAAAARPPAGDAWAAGARRAGITLGATQHLVERVIRPALSRRSVPVRRAEQPRPCCPPWPRGQRSPFPARSKKRLSAPTALS